MQIDRADVELELDETNTPTTRETLLAELRRCRTQAERDSNYTLSDDALESIADKAWALLQSGETKGLQDRLAQLIRERAQPIRTQAGRMLVSTADRPNRKARRQAAARARRK